MKVPVRPIDLRKKKDDNASLADTMIDDEGAIVRS